MTLLLISFLAGVLTVLAPCILPVLPIIIGRSVDSEDKHRPLVIVGSLAFAVVIFTLLLKASTAFIDIPQTTWKIISGGIIILFGLIYLFPTAWEKISVTLKLSSGSGELLQKSSQKKGIWGDILVGLSLGPVFSSCSPTYFLILATVLPQSYATGVTYLIAYALGLSVILLLISLLGQKLVKHLRGAADSHGTFKRILGLLFVLVGMFILTGADKKVQTYILDKGFLDVTKFEERLLTDPMAEDMGVTKQDMSAEATTMNYPRYKEITDPAGFVNSEPFELQDYVGKKIILLDFVTYSCINCQRTFPYLNAWYDEYEDDGLIIIGIHTPEFAFEHKKENVEAAAAQFGLKFPLVLDNDYGTWRAYGNRYWPRKYLIDIHGNIVYDHIGEGAYDETEAKIRELLEERMAVLNESGEIEQRTGDISAESVDFGSVNSPETYLGNARNGNPGVVEKQVGDVTTFSRPSIVLPNRVYLVGDWKVTDEYAEAVSKDARIIYTYDATKVFLVMGSENKGMVTVSQDGTIINEMSGTDIKNGTITVEDETLYRLIQNTESGEHTLELQVDQGVQAFAFTFG